jgi:lysophospholipase L1-like esterase
MSSSSSTHSIVFFCAFLCFLWLLNSSAFAQSEPSPPRKDPDPARFDAEIAAFENWDRQNAFPRNVILFVGSSSIRLWQTAESFPDLPVINRGFGGSHISDVNHFAERIVLKYVPRLIVFYAGDNDIAGGKSPRRVFGDFQRFAELVHARRPDTPIVFLSIKPSPSRWKFWPDVKQANASVAELAERDERIVYVDIAAPMLGPDGEPRSEIFLDDGLHLNEKGYALWTRILAPVIRETATDR